MELVTKILIWDDIDFDLDCIRIKPGRIKEILQPIPFKGSMPSLNAIKEEYFIKKYNKPFKLVFIGSRFSKDQSPHWVEISELIEKAIEIHRFPTKLKTINRKPKSVQKELNVSIEKVPKEKPEYLKLLANLQSPRFRLITILEKYEHKEEESHIYRCDTLSGRVLIIWENTKASRAAYLFIADELNMEERLARIEAFINTENVQFKRSRFRKLRENKQLRADLCFVGSVQHETLSQFQTEIKTYINRY